MLWLFDEDEKKMIEHIGQYKYLRVTDIPYFLNIKYYHKRIQKLIRNQILRRYKKYIILGQEGIAYMEQIGRPVPNKRIYKEQYIQRISFISHLDIIIGNNRIVKFKPSILLKDKAVYTETSLRYIRNNFYIWYRISYLSYTKRCR